MEREERGRRFELLRSELYRGDFHALSVFYEDVKCEPDLDASAWKRALDGHAWLAGLPHGSPVQFDRDRELLTTRSQAGCELCLVGERTAILRGSASELAEWADLHATVLPAGQPNAATGLAIAEGWSRAMDGRDPALEVTYAHAREQRQDHAVVEIKALMAYAALHRGDLQAATRDARLSARMSRAEEMPQLQYLANLVLARVRRASGQPHLAIYILRSLARVITRPWRAWHRWELALAGSESDGDVGTPSPLGHAAQDLANALSAVSTNDVGRFRLAMRQVESKLNGNEILLLEARDLSYAADSESGATPTAAMSEWVRGEVPDVPHGLHGLGGAGGHKSPNRRVGFVTRKPGGGGRRTLAVGNSGVDPTAVGLCMTGRPQERTATGLAYLLLADAPVPNEDFFLALYGFSYSVEHKSILDVLIRRIRDALGNAGELSREQGALLIVLRHRVSVPDPRCMVPLGDRVLALLAQVGTQSAKAVSRQLGIPLRTLQSAFASLVVDGACVSEKKGRQVLYRVEDTTYREATRTQTVIPK